MTEILNIFLTKMYRLAASFTVDHFLGLGCFIRPDHDLFPVIVCDWRASGCVYLSACVFSTLSSERNSLVSVRFILSSRSEQEISEVLLKNVYILLCIHLISSCVDSLTATSPAHGCLFLFLIYILFTLLFPLGSLISSGIFCLVFFLSFTL